MADGRQRLAAFYARLVALASESDGDRPELAVARRFVAGR